MTNITTLALNLLISERRQHRSVFAEKIIELLPQSNDSQKEQELRNNFLLIVAQCVENPNSDVRDLFYQIAEYYKLKINGVVGDVAIAA